MSDFNNKLRRSRNKAKLSAREAADLSGVGMSYIYQIEKGEHEPSLETVVKLSKVYNDLELLNDYLRRVNLLGEKQGDIKELWNLRNELVHQKIEDIIINNPFAIAEFIDLMVKYEKNLLKDITDRNDE